MPRITGPGDNPLLHGASNVPAAAQVPTNVEELTSAPWRASPAIREFRERPATNRSTSSIAMNPLLNRPLPTAFGGPGVVTVLAPAHRHRRRYRRRRCTTTRTVTRQSTCSKA